MAATSTTLTVRPFPYGVDNTQRRQIIYGTCAFPSGGTYATGGVALNWAALADGSGGIFIPNAGPGQTQPDEAFFFSTVGTDGYTYIFDQATNKLRIYADGTEVTNGTTVSQDTVQFKAEYLRGV